MRQERSGLSPALAVSAVIHVGALLAVIFLGGLFKKPVEMNGGVPVTLVSEGPPILRDAPEAEEEQLAQTEDPAPLPPEPEPQPQPRPTPPTPQPTPAKPTPTPPKPTPKPTPTPTPTPAKKPTPRQDLDLDRLLSDVQSSRPSRPTGGRQGPAKPDTTVKAGTSKGEISQASKGYLNNLGTDLGRRWNPNCEVEGGDQVNITLQIILNSNGRMLGPPQVIRGAKDDPITKAAITRAIFAARAAEPFKDFPAELAGEKLNFNLNAKTACSQ